MSGQVFRGRSFVRRFVAATRGATAVTVALFMTVVIGMCGFVIDLGHVAYVQRELQASADAAALAGAYKINCCATTSAATSATAYSATTGQANKIAGVTATMVTGYPALKCFSSTGVSCTMGAGVDDANGIVVKEAASVPMWFSSIFGMSAIPITVTATAGVEGGPTKNMNVEIVLDTTASMNTADTSCSVKNATRLTCAEAGVATLLGDMSYQADNVGLMVFPGPTTATASNDYNCSGSNPTSMTYSSSTNYQVLGLGNDFKSSSSGSNLSTSSDVVRAVGDGKSSSGGSCPGMAAPGGEGTYYAGAIQAAQAALVAKGGSSQGVIILLSDGDANATSSHISSTLASDQCAQAVTAANNATKAGSLVYTIAYGSSTSTSGSCSTDGGKYSACSALQAMATSSKYFYSDTQNGSSSCTSSNSTTDLLSAFGAIGQSFGLPRLLPDNTT